MEQKSDGAKSNGATEKQIDRAKERRIYGATEQRSDRATERRSDRNTKRRSDKKNIYRRLKCWRKIQDTRDDEYRFSHAPSVGVLVNYQEEGERCVVPGDVLDGMLFR